GRTAVRSRIGWGVGLAVAGSLLLGAIFTFGRYELTFQAQEVVGGVMSLVAVGMVTWMVFWMMKTGHRLKSEIEHSADTALGLDSGWGIFWIAFLSVGREGIETTLMLWGWVVQPAALAGALVGILVSVGVGYLLYRGMVRIDLGTFFAWTGAFLVIVSAGILAYAIHDLQEAAVLPGPFSGHPITPTDFRTGEVLTGFFDGPYWAAAFPFGWAFDLSNGIDPSGFAAAVLKGTVGFVPQMSWLEVTAWAIYLAIVFPLFFGRVRRNRAASRARKAAVASAATPANQTREPSGIPSIAARTAAVQPPLPTVGRNP
ncbi:MAG: FTR1 family protein, partial [Propionicimonas sp.]|nr:FTR1 family protein [Propionicimonas sp.]